MKRLFVIIEAPSGYSWEQEIEWRPLETVKTALSRCKKMLGRGYIICNWYIVRP